MGGGISPALNTGIANARGEYITFLEDDAELTLNSIACRLGALESAPPDVALTYGHLDFIDDSTGKRTEHYRVTLEGSEAFETSLRFDDFTGINCIFARTLAVQEIGGFDERFRNGMDVFFMCNIQLNYSIIAVRELVVIAHKGHGHPQATHWSNWGNTIDDLSVFRQHFADEIALRPGLHHYLARELPFQLMQVSALYAMRQGAVLMSLGFTARMVKAYPLNAKNLRISLHLIKGFLFYATPLRRLRRPLQRLLGQRV